MDVHFKDMYHELVAPPGKFQLEMGLEVDDKRGRVTSMHDWGFAEVRKFLDER